MGRIVTTSEYVTFVPEAFEQRERFDAGLDPNPIKIELRWLTAAEKREYEKALVLKVGKDRSVRSGNEQEIAEKLVTACVKSVANYSVNGSPILTGADLWHRGEKEITDEVLKALNDTTTLEAGRRDLSTSQSDG